MSHKTEQRKNAFKAKNIVHSSDRLRREAEQLRKDKRSSNLLAKRLKTDTTTDSMQSSSHFSNDYVKDAISKIKVYLVAAVACAIKLTLNFTFRATIASLGWMGLLFCAPFCAQQQITLTI